MTTFKLASKFKPAGDQPGAIETLTRRFREGAKSQVLLGVTGSGKTFTTAHMIASLNRPALVISPNKVLASQLYAEFKSFFPENAVEFFISYYDYYQPEAYVPQTDTYIEKDASINQQIDRLRLKATGSLLSRRDVVVVASVSCIYNIGSPENWREEALRISPGMKTGRSELFQRLVRMHYELNETEFARGKFRAKGAAVDVFPAHEETGLRLELGDDGVAQLFEIDPLSGRKLKPLREAWIYPAKHFVTPGSELERALGAIESEMRERVGYFKSRDLPLEAERIEQRTRHDLEMLRIAGYCHGIENYSRHLSGRASGERPFCLLDYFPKDFLLVIDESHVAVPQLAGMYEGDRSRKQTLIDFGFRLPSALDNRPLKFGEFEALMPQTLFVSATPGPYELARAQGEVAEQIIRPTGLVDPETILKPSEGQLEDLIGRVEARARKGERTLVTTLTKRTAEDLTEFLAGKGLRVRYLHSDIEPLERIQILKELREGKFDILVGINLLREGLDLPEVSLVAILGADHEGFLRSETTLIQIAGRASRNAGGQVVLYADRQTGSIERALSEMNRRRDKQLAYNAQHGITPKTIVKAVREMEEFEVETRRAGLSLLRDAERPLKPADVPVVMEEIEARMKEAADNLDFELATILRDELFSLRDMSVRGTPSRGGPRPRKAAHAKPR